MRPALILILAVITLLGCSAPQHRFADASAASCEVYRALFDQLPDRRAIFVRTASLPLPPIAGVVPTRFERDTGAFETVETEGVSGSFEFPIREEFAFDTSAYSEALRSGPFSIASCFSEGDPRIYDGSFELLHLRENLLNRDDEGFVTLWTVSPVAISPDGIQAIMYGDHYCGGLCAGGAYLVFEKQQHGWVLVGDRGVWAS
jgi:hypothetical protein